MRDHHWYLRELAYQISYQKAVLLLRILRGQSPQEQEFLLQELSKRLEQPPAK